MMGYIEFMEVYLPHKDCADCERNNTVDCSPNECMCIEKFKKEVKGNHNLLQEYKNLGLEPSQLKEISPMYQAKCEEVAQLKKALSDKNIEEQLNEAYDIGYQSCLNFNKGMKWDEAEELQRFREKLADGRMVELPCTVGDFVYADSTYFGILAYEITLVQICCGISYESVASRDYEMLDERDFDIEDIGKSVFLTKEEAEQSLKESGDSHVPI